MFCLLLCVCVESQQTDSSEYNVLEKERGRKLTVTNIKNKKKKKPHTARVYIIIISIYIYTTIIVLDRRNTVAGWLVACATTITTITIVISYCIMQYI